MEKYKNRDWLYDQYWNKEKPISQIAKECSCGNTTIYRWMIKFDIPRRTQSESQTKHWDELLYGQKHKIIKKLKPKPSKRMCELCNQVYDQYHKKKLDLMNIDHQYKEDLKDWKYAHRSCHVKYDFDNDLRIITKEHKNNISNAKLGNKAWNKGLTKETDERVRRYGEKLSKIHKEISKKRIRDKNGCFV